MLTEGLSEQLWAFGFRHHADLQTKWIEGAAGLGTIARLSDQPTVDPIDAMSEEFLSTTNPKLLEAIKKAPPGKKEELVRELRKNFAELQRLIEMIEDS